MAEGDGGDLIFDWELLDGAKRLLDTKPQDRPLQNAMGMSVFTGAFGTAAGGAEAAGRLNAWLTGAVRDLTTVNSEVAALSSCTGEAARMARDLDPATRAIAGGGGPAVAPTADQIAAGESQLAGAIDAPAPTLGGN